MSALSYVHPSKLNSSVYFTGPKPFRLKSLLILCGQGYIDGPKGKIKLDTDFLSIPSGNSAAFKISSVSSKIPNSSNAEFRRFIKNAAVKNIQIHENIFNELMHCMYHYKNTSYIASFLHLYRLIEHTALYLPMVSIVSKGINNLTFNNYKEMLDKDAKSDLAVLRKFSSDILDPNVSEIAVRYSFSNSSSPQSCMSIIRKIMDIASINTTGNDYADIKYKFTDRLIINFRNQFFHYLSFEKNISLKELHYPEEFLEACLPNFITYFAFLYQTFLIAEWELWSN